MKKIILLALVVTFVSAKAQYGKGKAFPAMEAETFTEKPLNLPADCKGKFSIIGMCFSKDAEGDLQTWLNPLFNAYAIKQSGNEAMGVAPTADVNFYLMPKFSLLNQVFEKGSKNKIKTQTDKGFWPNLMFYTSGLKDYKKALEIAETAQPVIFILNPEGVIVHIERGVCNDKKMSAIDDVVNAD
ncbi:MAG TPA: hypothetical protein VNY73_06250 [Bacteroidia bacterium]|nr:hypothetical protein [Bacteroidia bacterium]